MPHLHEAAGRAVYKVEHFKNLILAQEKNRFIGKEETIHIKYEIGQAPMFSLRNKFGCQFPRSHNEFRHNKGRIIKYLEIKRPVSISCMIIGIDADSEEYILELTKEQQEEIHLSLNIL